MINKPEISVFLLSWAILIHLTLKDRWRRYFRCYQIDKRTRAKFEGIEHQQTILLELYINSRSEPIDQPGNKKKPWNGKLIRRLLITVTMIDWE